MPSPSTQTPRRKPCSESRALGTRGTSSAAAELFDLARANGATVALRDIGMRAIDIGRAADIAVSNPHWNPRPTRSAQRTEICELLQRAFEGVHPDATR